MTDTLDDKTHDFPRRLQQALARAPQPVPAPALLLPDALLRTPPIVSSAELSGLWHLPTPRLQGVVRHLPSRHLPAPPQVFVDGTDDRLIVGYARRADGRMEAVGPTWRDLREILHVVAGQGAGKTRLVVNLVQQSFKRGCTLMNGKGDDHGGASEHVRKILPRHAEDRLVIWNPLDAEWPISTNPLASIDVTHPGLEDHVLGMVQSVFQRIDPEGMRNGPVMKMLLDMGTLLVLGGSTHPTLAHIEQALIDPAYRTRLLPHVLNPKVRAYWEARRDGYSEREQQSLEALLRRFHTLLTSELVRSMVIQPQPLFSFDRAMDERWIVLTDLPHNRLGGLAGVVGMLIFGMFIRAALQRAGDAQSRVDYPLFVDEVQVFLEHSDGKDFALALSQLRGFGVPTAYLHQALMQLGSYRELMRVNAGSRIIMRTKYPDSIELAREYEAWGLVGTDISALDPLAHQYAVLRVHTTEYGPLSIEPLGWPQAQQEDLDERTVIASLTRRWRRRPTASWQQQIPPDSPDPEVDREVLRLVYGQHGDQRALIDRCADSSALSATEWSLILQRWSALRDWHRQHLLDHPDSIDDRLERQTWLSRLLACHPRILTRIDCARRWRQIDAVVQHQAQRKQKSVVLSSVTDGGSAGTTGTSAGRAPEPPRPLFAQVDDPVACAVEDAIAIFGEDDDIIAPS